MNKKEDELYIHHSCLGGTDPLRWTAAKSFDSDWELHDI